MRDDSPLILLITFNILFLLYFLTFNIISNYLGLKEKRIK